MPNAPPSAMATMDEFTTYPPLYGYYGFPFPTFDPSLQQYTFALDTMNSNQMEALLQTQFYANRMESMTRIRAWLEAQMETPVSLITGATRYYGANCTHAELDGDMFIRSEAFTTPIADLKNAKLGVEASYYLKRMIEEAPAHEPLLAALGGAPIALRQHIEEELDRWTQNGISPLFVFDGQSVVGKDSVALRSARAALGRTQNAWDLYADNHPSDAVKTFGSSGATHIEDLYPILQDVLIERNLHFIVAPFSAGAQLAYLESLDTPYIDGVMGSKELLLYDIHDAVIFPPTSLDWDKKSVTGVLRSDLIKKLNVTPDMFADALLMTGSSFLPPFPPLQDENIISRQPFSVLDAVNLLRTSEKSVTTTCAAFSDILQLRDPNWLDKYRKAKMGVKHCVTVQEDGSVHIREFENLTSDNVEYLGLQLPPELYHYLSTSLIGPRLMNSFGSLESTVFPTLDGVLSDEYRRLVTTSLPPLKETASALISSRMHRGFQYKNIIIKFWFDENQKQELVHRNVVAQTNQKADKWGVQDADLEAVKASTKRDPGTFSFALASLQEDEFPEKTVSKSTVPANSLKSPAEIASNALWRLLHLRGYIDDKHQLTSWGKALAVSLSAVQPAVQAHKDVHHIEEAVFLAYELLRFDNLNSRNRHTELIGGPLRGTDDDKSCCILIGRAACLLKLRHKNIGYTGPLSKNFLSFYSIIKAVRESDRDLLEAITASMFLSGQASRDQEFSKLGRSLPLNTDINVGLGIAVKTYLDDYLKLDTSPEQRAELKVSYAAKFLPNSVNIAEDLDVAFDFFEALYEGVKTLESDIPQADRKAWDEAKAYLALRR